MYIGLLKEEKNSALAFEWIDDAARMLMNNSEVVVARDLINRRNRLSVSRERRRCVDL